MQNKPDEITKNLILEGTRIYMALGKVEGEPNIFWRTSDPEVKANIINLTRLMLQAQAQDIIW